MPNNVRTAILALAAFGVCAHPSLGATLRIGHVKYAYYAYSAFGEVDPLALSDCLEGLVTEDARGNAIAGQAESWDVSPDGLVYTFKLRRDTVWSDGTPVVAADFLAGFRWLFDPANAVEYAYIHFPIRNASAIAGGTMPLDDLGVRVKDDHTLEIELERPTPYFLETLTHATTYPLPSKRLAALGKDALEPESILCNGPFVIVEQDGHRARAVKSETYYARHTVALDEVTYQHTDHTAKLVEHWNKGELDVAFNLPMAGTNLIDGEILAQIEAVPALGVSFYALNLTKPPFDNVVVRRALSMAIDRRVMGAQGLNSPTIEAYGLIPNGISNYEGQAPYRPEWADWPYEERLARARSDMAELGYSSAKPLLLELRYAESGSGTHQPIARQVAAMWAQIGVRVELHGSESDEHFAALRVGDFDVGRFSWIFDYSDPQSVLALLTEGADYNSGQYTSSRYNQLLAGASGELNLRKRADMLRSAEKLLLDDVAVIPVSWLINHNLVSERVTGIENNAENIHLTRWLSLAP
ncbi:MAG TPA: peptide ABC transporter substrate-binding protein [Devosia sp.]|jgi:oligopeptide transport system substrate-binding protein|uniref:peptide ABC transporter substrate-binding protein n=1 Tax=Devosia sp. TaxID=1871048 RepID=UPI002F95D276